jgi:2-polyprenyl-6-methoxyphenol hydroxylase-like FAD-dependent oxidoreductase
MAAVKKVLIVGGGIAGLCTAIGLQGSDAEVEIVELNPKWDVYGVGIIQLANALRALAALGLAERAVKEGFPMSSLVMYAPNGHQLAHIPQPQIAGPSFPSQNGISRPKLHAILQDAVQKAGAKVRLGITVQSIEQNDEHVNVAFTDNSTGQYDLVIGADGLRSKVRQIIFGNELQPKYEGQVVWRYNFRRPEEVNDIWMWMGDPKVGIVPLSPEMMYMFITDAAPDGIPRYSEETLAAEMQKRLEGYKQIPLLAKLREEINDSSKIVLRPFETILMPVPWNKGRVVLVGDSAHAMTAHIAQGAAMAIEDAVVLSEELKQQADLSTALANYNQRRVERVSKLVEMSRQICEWERSHDPNADVQGVTIASMKLAAQPI